MDILNLSSLEVIDVQENPYDYYITAKPIDKTVVCTHCGVVDDYYRFGVKEQVYMDTPIHGKRVGILVIRQRYRCKACNGTFFGQLPDIDDKRELTRRLVSYIERLSLERTFVSIADEVGVDEKTVRNIFSDYVERMEQTHKFATPSIMGIDEIHLIKPRCVITNVGERTLFDILKNREKKLVTTYLQNVHDISKVEIVNMDMWQPYKDSVRAVIPKAMIIVDKYHIQRMANDAMEKCRKHIRSTLDDKQRKGLMHDRFILLKRKKELTVQQTIIVEAWTKAYPILDVAYSIKEEFFDIWESADEKEAKERYSEWCSKIPEEFMFAYEPILTAIGNWKKEIFSYFHHKKYTNAYTESLNGLIRVADRIGRGYSFDVMRAKMLFTKGIHKPPKPKYQKRDFDSNDKGRFDMGRSAEQALVSMYKIKDIDYSLGADISTLTELIKEGRL